MHCLSISIFMSVIVSGSSWPTFAGRGGGVERRMDGERRMERGEDRVGNFINATW